MARWKRIIGRIALFTVSLVVSLFLCEVGLRAYLSKAQNGSLEEWKAFSAGRNVAPRSKHPLAAITRISANKRIIYELKPGVQMDFGGFPLAINNAGMREDREYPVERLPASIRIIGIGDSGMFGWNVNQGGEYLSVLESNLNARADGTTYEVINMATPGYNTRQEVELLKARGLQMKPDVVIVGWCENDFNLPFFMYTKKNHWKWNVSYLYCLVFDRKRFGELVTPEVVKAREMENTEIAPDVLNARGEEGMRKTLAELKAMSTERGFKTLVFGAMRKDIRALCKEAGIEYCNTSEELNPNDYPRKYLLHHMHPKPEGHKILGDHLVRVLEKKGWIKSAGTATNAVSVVESP